MTCDVAGAYSGLMGIRKIQSTPPRSGSFYIIMLFSLPVNFIIYLCKCKIFSAIHDLSRHFQLRFQLKVGLNV